MYEGIILRSIFLLLVKLKSCYEASITRRIVDAFSSFFRNLCEGSLIFAYFRKYEMNSSFLTESFSYKFVITVTNRLNSILKRIGGFLNRTLEASRTAEYYAYACNHMANNILRAFCIFIGFAAAAYLSASLLGGTLDSTGLVSGLGLIAVAVTAYGLPLDIRKALESSIFFRLVKYIFS